MIRLVMVAIGGAAGAVARYLVGGIVAERCGTNFPYGTLAVNVSGSFLLGFLVTFTTDRFVSPSLRTTLGVGFLGAYTTFSTFEYESLQLLVSGSVGRAALNIVVSLSVGLLAVWLGTVVARLL